MDRTVVLKFDTRVLVVIGALLVMLAAWLPWTNLPSFVAGDLARRGVDGGGLITFGLSLLALLSLLLPWHPLRRVSLAAAILAALINLVALIAFARVIQLSDSLGFLLGAQLGSVSSGLALTFAGLVLMLFGGLAETTSPSPFARQTTNSLFIDMVSPRQMEVALRAALAGLLVASCLCAWGVGLLIRPYTLVSLGQAPGAATFRPAPTTFLATPLVDVRLAPLGAPSGGATVTAGTTVTVTAAPIRPTVPVSVAPTSAPVGAASPASPTPRGGQPTVPSIATFATEPTRALPTQSAPTPVPPTPIPPTPTLTPPVSPPKTPTASATPTLTPTSTP